jgi:hypothetical protein
MDISNGVVAVSTQEDVLWRFTGDPAQAELERLTAFAEVCKALGVALGAVLGVIGTEGPRTDDLSIERARESGARPLEEILSVASLRECSTGT